MLALLLLTLLLTLSFPLCHLFARSFIGMAPFEALVVSTIGDIFFVHERGFRSAIWGFAILAGINVSE